MRRLKAVVFDLDGTLVHSRPHIAAILNDLRCERGMNPWPEEKYSRLLSIGGRDLIQSSLDLDDQVTTESMLERFRKRHHAIQFRPVDLYEGVCESLDLLRHAELQLALCTNKPAVLTCEVLKGTNLVDYFCSVVCGDSTAARKPDPLPLKTALERMGVNASEAIFVGDSCVDQLAAQRANVEFFHFRGGYDDGVDVSAVAATFSEFTELTRRLIHVQRHRART